MPDLVYICICIHIYIYIICIHIDVYVYIYKPDLHARGAGGLQQPRVEHVAVRARQRRRRAALVLPACSGR